VSEGIEFTKLRLSVDELRQIPPPQLAAFAVSCYAINELNTMNRIYLCAENQQKLGEAAQIAELNQRLVLARIINAKLFEFSEFAMLKGKYNRTQNKTLKDLASAALEGFEELKGIPGYQLAKTIRNEATNHYQLSPAAKSLEHLDRGANCDIFIHRLDGNSLFPLGEELIFGAGLHRAGKELLVLEGTALKSWLEWGLKAMEWTKEVHMRLFEEAILPHISPRTTERFIENIPDGLFQSPEMSSLPLFLKTREVTQ
tara:strand:+ start:97 stop:867 length:771 start_codon:yes stop_codon:yes gene_type:complete